MFYTHDNKKGQGSLPRTRNEGTIVGERHLAMTMITMALCRRRVRNEASDGFSRNHEKILSVNPDEASLQVQGD